MNRMDDPEYWRRLPGYEDKPITDQELDILSRIQRGDIADITVDPFSPVIEFFSSIISHQPVRNNTHEPKTRNLPSKSEAKIIKKLVRAIRKGWIQIRNKHSDIKEIYDLWDYPKNESSNMLPHIPAPKLALPSHNESYRPPSEYITSKEEIEKWKSLKERAPKSAKKWVPMLHSCLRHISSYPHLIQERFSRCLNLYLCPRVLKNKLQIDPDSLLPKLPNPKDLRPYPTTYSTNYLSASDSKNTCSCFDPTGHWIATGSNQGTLYIWDILTTRLVYSYQIDDNSAITSISWNPNPNLSIIAITFSHTVRLISLSALANTRSFELTKEFLSKESSNSSLGIIWKSHNHSFVDVLDILLPDTALLKHISWHRKGDYLTSVSYCPTQPMLRILVHQISKNFTQSPFKRVDGKCSKAFFHPTKPHLFVLYERTIKQYNLSDQSLVKGLELDGSGKLLSSFAIHKNGDHVIACDSLESQVCWFDLDYSIRPYRTFKSVSNDVLRQVVYHNRYSLFASCSEDGKINIYHSMVYDDLLHNPLIVPVKKLKTKHQLKDIAFHPYQPWIIGCGQDQISLFVPTVY